MGAGIVTIQAYLALADALWGSSFVQAIINGLHAGGHLTEGEKAQLEANHADYQARIARREAEGAATQEATPPAAEGGK